MSLVATVVAAMLVHPVLIQLHEQAEHDCGQAHASFSEHSRAAAQGERADLAHAHDTHGRDFVASDANVLEHDHSLRLVHEGGCGSDHGHVTGRAQRQAQVQAQAQDDAHAHDGGPVAEIDRAVESDLAQDDSNSEATHDHHCFHCVLCYTAAQASLHEASFNLVGGSLVVDIIRDAQPHATLAASINPASPRAPPVSFLGHSLS